jgi:hypothetical protein
VQINTCNGFYCDQFTPNSPSKPKLWTENWRGWFLSFGGAVPYRPVKDLAFYQRGGTFQNYYMVIPPPFHVQQLCFYCLASLPDRPNVKSARSAYSRSCCCIFSNSG